MNTKIFLAIALMVAIIAVTFAQNGKEDVAKLPNDMRRGSVSSLYYLGNTPHSKMK